MSVAAARVSALTAEQSAEAPSLDERAAARYFAVSPETMRLWRRMGKGPRYFKLCGKLIRYAPADLADWKEKQGCRSIPSGGLG